MNSSEKVVHFADISCVKTSGEVNTIRLQLEEQDVSKIYEADNVKFNVVKHTETVIEESLLDRPIEVSNDGGSEDATV